MGNKPVNFLRQVLAMVTCPDLIETTDFAADAKDRARTILGGCRGGSAGSYSDSPGIELIRRHVADYITRRDGGIQADWLNVILCAGASEGIRVSVEVAANELCKASLFLWTPWTISFNPFVMLYRLS